MPGAVYTFAGFGLVFILLVIICITIGILSLIFWIKMIIDVANRNFKKSDDKIIWLLIVILLGLLGALIYYFTVKRK